MATAAGPGYDPAPMIASQDSPAPPTTPNALAGRHRLVLTVAAIVLMLFRLHAFHVPLENDECNYAVIAGRLLDGDRLYVDVWDHQPFGVFALLAPVIALFGDGPEVFRWLATAFSLASLLLIFGLTRRLIGPTAGVVAAILFALVSSDPGTAGDGCNRETYMNALILAAWYGLARYQRGRWRWLLAAGAALAAASAIKTIVAVHWVVLASWMLMNRRRIAPGGWKAMVTALAAFAAAPIALWSVSSAYFGATGRWEAFTDAVFRFNLSYSAGGGAFPERFVRFFTPTRFPYVFDSALPLWCAGGAALVWLVGRAMVDRRRGAVSTVGSNDGSNSGSNARSSTGSITGSSAWLIAALIVGGYLAAALPAQYWPHYYYLLIPGLCVAAAALVARIAHACRPLSSPAPRRSKAIRVIVMALLPVALLIFQYRHYLRQPPFGITVARYNSRDFWGRAQGENVRRVTSPGDRIFVYGNDASIYYYARRRCASRFTMITGLAEGMEGADRRRRALMSDLKHHPPRLIVVLFDQPPFSEWKAFLAEHYGEPVGWDHHDRTGKPIMFVLARVDQPIEPIDWNWDRAHVGGWQLGDRRP